MSITPLWQLQKKCSSCYCGLIDGQTHLERQDIQQSYTLPKTNIAPENWPSQKESSLPYLFSGAMLVPGRALFQARTSDCENGETESQRFDCITTCPMKKKNSKIWDPSNLLTSFCYNRCQGPNQLPAFPKIFWSPNHQATKSWREVDHLRLKPMSRSDLWEKHRVALSINKTFNQKKRNKTIVGPSDPEVTTSWSESQVWMNDSHSNPISVAKVAQFHHQAFTVHDGETWP